MNRIVVATFLGLAFAAPVRGSPQPADFTTLGGSWTVLTMRTTGGTREPGLPPTKDSAVRTPGIVYAFEGSELVVGQLDWTRKASGQWVTRLREGATRARLQMGAAQGGAGSFLVMSGRPGGRGQWMLFERQGDWLKIATNSFDGSLPKSFEPSPGLQVLLLLSEAGWEARSPCLVLKKAGVDNWLGFSPKLVDRGFEAPLPGPVCVAKRELASQREVSLMTVFGADSTYIQELRSKARSRGTEWQQEPDLGENAFSLLSENMPQADFVALKNHTLVMLTFRGPQATPRQMRDFARRVFAQF